MWWKVQTRLLNEAEGNSGDSGIKNVGGALRGQGKSRGAT